MRMTTKSLDVTRYLPSPVMTPSPLPSSPISIDLFPTQSAAILYNSITALKMTLVYISHQLLKNGDLQIGR